MELHQIIVTARKKKGLTQEELADLTKVTARTIQRIESGDSIPRHHTLKAIASVLELTYEDLITEPSSAKAETPALTQQPVYTQEDARYFLQLLCLSCFSYLIVPFVHFLIPAYLLKRRKETNAAVIVLSRKIILTQIYWVIALHAVMLLTFIINFLQVGSSHPYYINYLYPFFLLYAINVMILLVQCIRMNQLHQPALTHAVPA